MALKRVWIPSPNKSSRGGSGVRLVVVHTAEGARSFRDLGGFFASSSAQVSSHVGIDDERGSIGEYVHRPDKAWAQANYNPQCICSELCAAPISSSYPCGANWTADEWNRHDNMLANTADWIREECAYYGLPIKKLSSSEAQGSAGGVCGHVELGSGGGGHWDPGPNFPWSRVIDMARGDAPAPTEQEADVVASATSGNGELHVWRADGKKLSDTWQNAGETSWHGGQPGKGPAGWRQFATADDTIVGLDAACSDGGLLHLFVECANGNTYYTYQQRSGGWAGGQAGKSIAGLSLFAP